jgi:succinate dehydrogenase / fumarate reductase cytochrome b subunit
MIFLVRPSLLVGGVKVTDQFTSDLKKAIKGWLFPFKYNLERWAYALQRISGLVVTGYFLAHIVETGNVVGGFAVWSSPSSDFARDVWTATFHFLDNPLFDIGLVVIGSMLAYHTINGIRLTLTEFGLLQGKPTRPDFPYEPKSFTKTQRALFWLSIIFAAAIAVYALNVFFGA